MGLELETTVSPLALVASVTIAQAVILEVMEETVDLVEVGKPYPIFYIHLYFIFLNTVHYLATAEILHIKLLKCFGVANSAIVVEMTNFGLYDFVVAHLTGVNFFMQVALVATSTTMMATEEITATLGVWIGGAASHHWNRLPCQTSGNHMLT